MNPNARSFAFNPSAQGFMPPQVAAQYAAQQQQEGGNNQQQAQQPGPDASQQQPGAFGEQQPYYQQQGGYNAYPQQGGYNAAGLYGGNQAGGNYYGGQGGQYNAGNYYQQQPGGYTQQQSAQPQAQQTQSAPASRIGGGGLPPKPSAADPNRKPVVMSLGGGNSAQSSISADSAATKKPVNISIGSTQKPVSISIGSGAAKKDDTSATSSKVSTPAPAGGVSTIKNENSTATPASASASPPGSRSESPAPNSGSAPVAGSTGSGAVKETKAPGAGQAAKKAAKIDQKVEKSETNAAKILEEAKKATDEETMRDLFGDKVDEMKSHLNIVFVGHVDAGKSTMGGQLLFLTGMVDKRTMEKYEKEAKEAGRETWYLSWALDSTPQEREKGKTVEVGRAYFETGKRRYTILDAPGHKTYVPSMISGAAQADVAILVISARKGEFETGFERGGQTREHAMLVKTAGVQRLVVVVNKMDDQTVQWDKERFDEIVTKLTPFLKGTGFNPKTDVTFIPVSAYAGQNLKEEVSKDICSWYSGPALLPFLDNLNLGDRKISEPLKMPISEKYNDMGTVVVGKLESGKVKKGDSLILMPNRSNVEVMAIYGEAEDEVPAAISGDNVRIKIKGVDHEDVSVGFVLTDPSKPVNVVRRFEAQLAILESRNIICAGYSAIMHVHTASEEISLQALLHYYDKKTGKKSRKPPQFAKKGMKIVALIETSAPICLEKFSDYPQLGRFTVRDEGRTIGIGKVTKLSPNIDDLPDIQKMAIADTAAVTST